MLCDGCMLQGNEKHEPNTYTGTTGGILFLGGFPDRVSCKAAFCSPRTSIVRQIADRNSKSIPASEKKPVCFYDYVCQCTPTFNVEAKRYDINAAVFSRCAAHVLSFIDLQKPDVVIALGGDAFHALGIKGSVPSRRGRIEHIKDKNGNDVPVVCTYDVSTINKDHGLVKVFEGDIAKGFKVALRNGEVKENILSCPTTYEDILVKLDNLYRGIDAMHRDHVFVAFDTETTSLNPQVKEDRIVSMSFSWAPNRGLAFPYDYKTQPATPELKEAVEKVLNHPKVKLVTANGSFDMRWLWARGIKCPNHYWDIMLAEHIIDETKQGCYGLKDITRDRFPEYANYEEELQATLNECWQKKDDAKKELLAKAKEDTSANMKDWWVGLAQDARLQYLADWVSAGYVDLKDTPYLSEVKYVKRKGEMVIPKKYVQALTKLLNRVPVSCLPENIHAVANIPPELERKTFEDVDLGVLLHYGALDAVATLLICYSQRADMKEDVAFVNEFRRKTSVVIPPIHIAYRDITMPLSAELARVQLHGIRVDRDKIRDYQKLLDERAEQVTEAMRMETGVSFNPNSTADLVRILFTDLGLPVQKYTDKGSPAVDADTLKDLADAHPEVKFLQNLMLYRKLDKTGHTYLENWLKLSDYDGCLHTSFLQTGTATYRLSSTNPW